MIIVETSMNTVETTVIDVARRQINPASVITVGAAIHTVEMSVNSVETSMR